MIVEEEYQRGVDSYWGGQIPTGWENANWNLRAADVLRVPYLAGWYQASLADNGIIY